MPYCKNCSKSFELSQKEKDFYAKMGTKEPSLCFDCRMQRKYAFRNERKMYQRQCDLCQQQIISSYPAGTPFPVYCYDCWWSDQWEALAYAQNFDFKRSFFPQLAELQNKVPHLDIPNTDTNVNSRYCSWADRVKNCYLVYSSSICEDCLYSEILVDCRDCVDCTNLKESENCYFSIDLQKCYNVKFSRNLRNCLDCSFCFDCADCSNCFLSYNLRHQQYCIRNVRYSPLAYEREVGRILANRGELVSAWNEFLKMMKYDAIHKFANLIKCDEEVDGDELYACKRSRNSFDSRELQDCFNIIYGDKINDCADSFAVVDQAELCLEVFSVNGGYQNMYGYGNWNKSRGVVYSHSCISCQDCFGCVGLKHKKNCILNKQYSEEDYKKTIEKILEQMKKSDYPAYSGRTEEWGEFFPVEFSPFAYNETMASVYYPLTKEEVLSRGWGWREENKISTGKETVKGEELPETLAQAPADITSQVLACAACRRNYKIIKQELDFYKKHNLPIPQMCNECRFKERLALRNPRKLWPRQCTCILGHEEHGGSANPAFATPYAKASGVEKASAGRCPVHFQTTYRPDGGEVNVYCEKCYRKEIY